MAAEQHNLTGQTLCCPLPQLHHPELAPPNAPDTTGSVFVKSEEVSFGQGNLITPVDNFSGIPLPLSPRYMEDRPSRFKWDDHHPWHERLHPLLQDVSGLALRASRVQHANYDTHHIDYHARTFRGPIIPDKEEDRLRAIILAAAGYIPDQAIAFNTRGDPEVVSLSRSIRKKLWYSGQVRVERPQAVRTFLAELALNQDLSDVNESTIDEFLGTADEKRRWELGNELLGRAVRRATEPINPDYVVAYKLHLLPRNRAHNASRFVLSTLSMKRRRVSLHKELQARLAA